MTINIMTYRYSHPWPSSDSCEREHRLISQTGPSSGPSSTPPTADWEKWAETQGPREEQQTKEFFNRAPQELQDLVLEIARDQRNFDVLRDLTDISSWTASLENIDFNADIVATPAPSTVTEALLSKPPEKRKELYRSLVESMVPDAVRGGKERVFGDQSKSDAERAQTYIDNKDTILGSVKAMTGSMGPGEVPSDEMRDIAEESLKSEFFEDGALTTDFLTGYRDSKKQFKTATTLRSLQEQLPPSLMKGALDLLVTDDMITEVKKREKAEKKAAEKNATLKRTQDDLQVAARKAERSRESRTMFESFKRMPGWEKAALVIGTLIALNMAIRGKSSGARKLGAVGLLGAFVYGGYRVIGGVDQPLERLKRTLFGGDKQPDVDGLYGKSPEDFVNLGNEYRSFLGKEEADSMEAGITGFSHLSQVTLQDLSQGFSSSADGRGGTIDVGRSKGLKDQLVYVYKLSGLSPSKAAREAMNFLKENNEGVGDCLAHVFFLLGRQNANENVKNRIDQERAVYGSYDAITDPTIRTDIKRLVDQGKEIAKGSSVKLHDFVRDNMSYGGEPYTLSDHPHYDPIKNAIEAFPAGAPIGMKVDVQGTPSLVTVRLNNAFPKMNSALQGPLTFSASDFINKGADAILREWMNEARAFYKKELNELSTDPNFSDWVVDHTGNQITYYPKSVLNPTKSSLGIRTFFQSDPQKLINDYRAGI